MFNLLFVNTGALVCFVVAGLLVYHGKPNWGWFLLVGVLISTSSYTVRRRKDDDD